MNNLLIFFAFPIAVIIVSIILQKLLNNPLLVASLIFAVFLIITFAAFDETFLIATLAYTILSFITAFITKIICNNQENDNGICNCLNNILSDNASTQNTNNTRNDNNYINYNRYKNF